MFLILFIIFMILLYIYGTRNFDYWEKRGVKFEKPIIFIGGNLKHVMDNLSVSERLAILYRSFPNEKMVGFFEGNNPAVLIRDPELIQHVLITDFRHFQYRGLNPYKYVIEPLMKNLFTVDGDVWKLMRQKLTPAFSSGKLKAMFPLIVERTKKLEEIANDFAENQKEVDIRELMVRYTIDVIGACGFGIGSAALNDANSDFIKLGKRIFHLTMRDVTVFFLKITAPTLFKDLNFFAPEIETKIISIIRQIMNQRNFMPSGRNDFIDMMLELKQKKKLTVESSHVFNPDGSPRIIELEVDDQLLAAQVFIFFAAGFETSSAASSYLLHMLAYHPEVQERCQKEVDEILNNYDGKLCFDAVRDMTYLKMAFKESMRCLLSPGFLIRKTASKYIVPGTNITLDEDMYVIISTEALCNDEKYFENPEKFIPERFHPDNIGNIKKCTYLPFGDGPRACIGERLGIMQSMAAVATILKQFSVAPSSNSIRKPLIDPQSLFTQNIIGGLPLALTRRKMASSMRLYT